ncbi:MAG TPA: carboxypeptidase-like regulatory domain-containing protein, partial [Chitinophagaceae bacterium]|nr:carboxypeptidase-like regulatory domain-containing protein [Chitinophagaceae bacterium]
MRPQLISRTGVSMVVLCLTLFFALTANAQTFQLKGRVVDSSSKNPIASATVLNKKSNKATITNTDGTFSILTSKGDALIITYVGYNEQNITVDNENFLEIILGSSSAELSDVVVTALGIKKEVKRLGYSVQEVKGEDLLKAREPNPVNGLAGKVSGLNVGINQELLASPTVLLRGSPLNFYVVDGIPVNSDTWNISPDDIETFTVLKGPSAAALYGSRGINGAIL